MRKSFFIALLCLLVAIISCSSNNQLKQNPDDFAGFQNKVDLKIRQIYETRKTEQKLAQPIRIFVKCTELGTTQKQLLQQLDAKLSPTGNEIVIVECPTQKLPAIAELDFVLTITAARQGRLKK